MFWTRKLRGTTVSALGDRQGVRGAVHCDDGGAVHIGPEPWVHARESMGEASAGEVHWPAIEPQSIQTRMPTLFTGRKARRTAHVIASARTIWRGRNPSMCGRSLYGNREISRSADGHVVRQGLHREGGEPKPMMYGSDKSGAAIAALRPTNKGERSAGGAKGGGQGECEPAQRGPSAETGNRVTRAGAHTASRNRASPSDSPDRSRMPELGTYRSGVGAQR
jgi:hypothetical protein